jgi:hypothetical protein
MHGSQDAAASGLTDRRSPAHTALSTVSASRAPPGPAKLILDISSVETKRAVTWRHLGCISSHMATDIRMVHQ